MTFNNNDTLPHREFHQVPLGMSDHRRLSGKPIALRQDYRLSLIPLQLGLRSDSRSRAPLQHDVILKGDPS